MDGLYIKNIQLHLRLDLDHPAGHEPPSKQDFLKFYADKCGFLEVRSVLCIQEVTEEGILPSIIFYKENKTIDDYIFLFRVIQDSETMFFRNDIRYIASYIYRSKLEIGETIHLAEAVSIWVSMFIEIHNYTVSLCSRITHIRLAELDYCLKLAGVQEILDLEELEAFNTYGNPHHDAKIHRCPMCSCQWADFNYSRHNHDLFMDIFEGVRIPSWKCDSHKCFYVDVPMLNFRGDRRLLNAFVCNIRNHNLIGNTSAPAAQYFLANNTTYIAIRNLLIRHGEIVYIPDSEDEEVDSDEEGEEDEEGPDFEVFPLAAIL